jgi:hypothetical protein
MFSYFAYGLGIHSEIPLTEFVSTDSACDVLIHLEQSDRLTKELKALQQSDAPWLCQQTETEIIYAVKHAGVFSVQQGKEVAIAPLPHVENRLLSLHLTGSIMAFISYQRGLLPLHASAIQVHQQVAAFLGESGAGKSSTAAALNARGNLLVTDDVLPVQLDAGAVQVSSAFPQLKLDPTVAGALGYDPGSLLLLHPRLPKLGHRVAHQITQIPLPLKAIYVLEDGADLQIERLQPQQAFVELIKHSYGIRALQSINTSTQFFSQCTTLAKIVNIYRLIRPRSLAQLPELAESIEAHFLLQNTTHTNLTKMSLI